MPLLPGAGVLRGMPTEGPPAQQVEVQVIDRLPALAVTIDHKAEPTIRDSDLSRDPVRHQQQVSEQPIISLVRIEECRQVLTGNNQDMDRRFLVNIFEGDRLLVLIDNLPWTFSVGDLTKETGIHSLALSILRLTLFPVTLAQFPSYL